MAAPIVDTLIEPLSVVSHDVVNLFFYMEATSWITVFLKASVTYERCWHTLALRSRKKKIAGYQISEYGGNPISPRKKTRCPEIISLKIISERRDV